MFPKLCINKISKIHNIINKSNYKDKPRLNITTKDLFKKQVIISMGTNNVERVIVQSNMHIVNINKLFKGIKSEVSVDFIWSNIKSIIVITNKIDTMSDLNIIEKYVKSLKQCRFK